MERLKDILFKKIENKADNLRFFLEECCAILDDRNSFETRESAFYELIERPHLYNTVLDLKEIVRDIANFKTDK